MPPVKRSDACKNSGFIKLSSRFPLTPNPRSVPCVKFAIKCNPIGNARLFVRIYIKPNNIDAKNIFREAIHLTDSAMPGLLRWVKRNNPEIIICAGHTPMDSISLLKINPRNKNSSVKAIINAAEIPYTTVEKEKLFNFQFTIPEIVNNKAGAIIKIAPAMIPF